MANHHLAPSVEALVLVLGFLDAASRPLSAQVPTTGGFLFSYQPHSGERPLFDAGYRRHLDWHESMADSLSWFGWDVLVGPRPNYRLVAATGALVLRAAKRTSRRVVIAGSASIPTRRDG